MLVHSMIWSSFTLLFQTFQEVFSWQLSFMKFKMDEVHLPTKFQKIKRYYTICGKVKKSLEIKNNSYFPSSPPLPLLGLQNIA